MNWVSNIGYAMFPLSDSGNAGAIGKKYCSERIFCIPERFGVFAATGYNAVLGIYLYSGFEKVEKK